MTGRKQFAVIKNVTSRNQEILTGIPEGSVLGALLFVNDLNTCMYTIFRKRSLCR